MYVLEAKRLCKVFGGGATRVTALWEVDLQVRRGELLAIMGPSGSGKSTLLHLLGGVEPPTSGEVFLEGEAFGSLNDEQRSLIRRRRVGFVFQKINLLPILSAAENVALPLLIDGTPRAAAMARAAEALELVRVAERASHLPAEMSGGEQQRVGIARALVINPAVILADEPTGAIDRATGKHILAELRALRGAGPNRGCRHPRSGGRGRRGSVSDRVRRPFPGRGGRQTVAALSASADARGRSVMRLQFLIWREWRARPGRAVLTLLSVAFAVAAVLGTSLAQSMVRRSYAAMSDALAGPPALDIVAAEGGRFPLADVPPLNALQGVRARCR